MTIHTLTIAGLSALCLILLAAVWYWHAQYRDQRIRAEQSDDWSDYWQHWSEEWRDRAERATATLAAATEEINTLRERNAHLQALHAERVRQLLAKNYTVIDRNIQWRRTGK